MTSDTDRHFMAIALDAAKKSGDRSTEVGCVIVGPGDRNEIESCNGFPAGVDDRVEARHERPEKYLWTEHAERNAIYRAARIGVALQGCRMYLPWYPCMDCARAIIQSGIVELVAVAPNLDDPTWGDQFKRVGRMLEEGGVAVRFVEP